MSRRRHRPPRLVIVQGGQLAVRARRGGQQPDAVQMPAAAPSDPPLLDWRAINKRLRQIPVGRALAVVCARDPSLCPVCAAALYFNERGTRATCSRCGADGTAVDFVRLARRVKFHAAIRAIAPLAGLNADDMMRAYDEKGRSTLSSAARLLERAERLLSDIAGHPQAEALLADLANLVAGARAGRTR